MRIGDLVRWKTVEGNGPIGIVIASRGYHESTHARIRVFWSGKDIPVQAKSCSVKKDSRITTWLRPKYFEKAFVDKEVNH